jgi:hypothetical protein
MGASASWAPGGDGTARLVAGYRIFAIAVDEAVVPAAAAALEPVARNLVITGSPDTRSLPSR